MVLLQLVLLQSSFPFDLPCGTQTRRAHLPAKTCEALPPRPAAVLEEMDGDDSGEVELPELRHWLGELRKRGGGDLLKGVSSTAVAAAAVRAGNGGLRSATM